MNSNLVSSIGRVLLGILPRDSQVGRSSAEMSQHQGKVSCLSLVWTRPALFRGFDLSRGRGLFQWPLRYLLHEMNELYRWTLSRSNVCRSWQHQHNKVGSFADNLVAHKNARCDSWLSRISACYSFAVIWWVATALSSGSRSRDSRTSIFKNTPIPTLVDPFARVSPLQMTGWIGFWTRSGNAGTCFARSGAHFNVSAFLAPYRSGRSTIAFPSARMNLAVAFEELSTKTVCRSCVTVEVRV